MPSKKQDQPQGDRINRAIAAQLERDPYLTPYKAIIQRRLKKIAETENRLTQDKTTLTDLASGHEYFGLHFRHNQWVFREWAPHATALYLIGDMTGWQEKQKYALQPLKNEGVWEIHLPRDGLKHGDLIDFGFIGRAAPVIACLHMPGGWFRIRTH